MQDRSFGDVRHGETLQPPKSPSAGDTSVPSTFEQALEQFGPLVRNLVGSYHRTYRDVANYDDCYSLGVQGLWEAFDSYDPEEGAAFFSWAYRLVLHRLDTGLRLYWRRSKRFGARLVVSTEMVDADGESYTLEGIDPTPLAADALSERESHQETYAALSVLSGRERAVLELRFFGDLTLDEVGQRLGFSRERARQLEERSLRKLRTRLIKNRGMESLHAR